MLLNVLFHVQLPMLTVVLVELVLNTFTQLSLDLIDLFYMVAEI